MLLFSEFPHGRIFLLPGSSVDGYEEIVSGQAKGRLGKAKLE